MTIVLHFTDELTKTADNSNYETFCGIPSYCNHVISCHISTQPAAAARIVTATYIFPKCRRCTELALAQLNPLDILAAMDL